MTAGSRDSDDMIQATWLYHIGQMSQEEVSRRMGLSRFKVLRLLQDARDQGLVRVSKPTGWPPGWVRSAAWLKRWASGLFMRR